MLEMVRSRQTSEKKEVRYDFFSSLLDASEGKESDATLTEQELLGEL